MNFKKRIRKEDEPCGVNIVVDKMHFAGPIDATDPCYNKSVWCRVNDLPIEEGDYNCVVVLSDEDPWGIQVQKIGIYLNGKIPSRRSMETIGHIGVDAGLAGFFMNKPDYSEADWDQVCNECRNGCAWTTDEGFFSESGYGDGGYDLFGHRNYNGVFDALEIIFIE